MNQAITPKLKPRPPQDTPESPVRILKPMVELAALELKSGEAAPGFDQIASLDGLGLLVEIAKIGSQMIGPRHEASHDASTHPVDPRKRIDPRKRDLPR